MFLSVLAVVTLAFSLAMLLLAARTRQRRLQVTDVVLLDGRPVVVQSIEFRLNAPAEYAFELLGEYLARTIRVANRDVSLGQLMIEEGWRPPLEGGPR